MGCTCEPGSSSRTHVYTCAPKDHAPLARLESKEIDWNLRAREQACITSRAPRPVPADSAVFDDCCCALFVSLQKGQVYYWNTKTNKTQWNEPQGFEDMKH